MDSQTHWIVGSLLDILEVKKLSRNLIWYLKYYEYYWHANMQLFTRATIKN